MTCILCRGTDFDLVVEKVRFDIPRGVVRCVGCGLVCLQSPEADAIDYEADYERRHGPVLGRESPPQELFEIYKPLQAARLSRVSHLLTRESSVLEVGCSTGHFLEALQGIVHRRVGIELSSAKAAFARDRCRIDVYEEPLEDSPLRSEQFDVIFAFQVFEHVAHPLRFLRACADVLAPNGIIYFEVPNLDDVLLSVFQVQSFRKFYFRLPHVYYYSASTLPAVMRAAGFEGTVSFSQEYSIFNHLNWLLTGSPQRDVTTAYGTPQWRPPELQQEASAKVAEFFADINAEYRELLETAHVAQNLCFQGRRFEEF